MFEPSNILLPVADPLASARFYGDILGLAPVEAGPNFVLFMLPSGLGLGLWDKTGVVPAPTATAGCVEIGFKVESGAAVDAAHAAWRSKGCAIALAPTDLEFGRSFVAADPDGHRLRVYALYDEV